MKIFKSHFLGLILLFYISLTLAESKNHIIILSYWPNDAKHMTYPMSGSINDNGNTEKNHNLLDKLNNINILAYAFLQVDKEGNIYFNTPKIDLSKNNLVTFCKLHKSSCPNAQSKEYRGNFDAFSKINNKYHNLKKIISIGGGADRSSFSNTLEHPQNFIESAYTIIKTHKLNGIDLDFELDSVFTKDQAKQYAQLVQKLRKKLGNEFYIGVEMPGDHETLHSVGRNNWSIISKNAYVSIMGYDFHGYSYPAYFTGNNSNLFSDSNEPNIKDFYHISDDQAVKYLTYLGVPVNKIILGFPAYFRAYGSVPSKNNGLYQPFDPKLTPSFNLGKGLGSQILIPKLLKEGFISHTVFNNGKISAVYAYNASNREWISFENEKSVSAKANYVKNNHLAGIMMWNIKEDLPANNSSALLPAVYRELQ